MNIKILMGSPGMTGRSRYPKEAYQLGRDL